MCVGDIRWSAAAVSVMRTVCGGEDGGWCVDSGMIGEMFTGFYYLQVHRFNMYCDFTSIAIRHHDFIAFLKQI